jgi:phosphoribosylaminoimidazole-succinocarboxamide synthase
MTTAQKLYEGKAKILYTTDDPNVVLTVFKDDATAFNAQKRGSIAGKGELNCAISSYLFEMLAAQGIPTHYLDRPSANTLRVRAVKILPIEVVVRNIAAGSLCQQTGIPLGTVLKPPLVEFYYKNDALGDPLLTSDRLFLLELATPEQVNQIKMITLKINDLLSAFFGKCAITLVDFKLEFGLDDQHRLMLADEISPDTCRLWDQQESDPNRRILDKDRFRQDLGDVATAYQQVLERILAHISQA